MMRASLLFWAFSATVLAGAPVYAKTAVQDGGTTKAAKIKSVKGKKAPKPGAQQTAAQPGESAASGTQVASNAAGSVGRAVPVAATHANFFATPLGLLTAAGAAGGTAAGAAALSAKGSSSSPN